MTPISQIMIGAALVAAGWMLVRRVSGTRLIRVWFSCLDGAVPASVYGILIAFTGRPIFCGVTLLAFLAALAYADSVKRRMLREPIVFFDVYQTVDVIFRHPQVDILVSVNSRSGIAGILGAAGLLAVLLLEPPLWHWTPWPGILAVSAVAVVLWVASGPALASSGKILRRSGATGDAVLDAAEIGPFAMHFVHVLLARAEREVRRAAAQVAATPSIRRARGRSGSPVIVVQSESFFDARRLGDDVPADMFPAFDRHCADGVQWGRLTVPGIGGNTMRTEFAVLTGLAEDAIGFDRFNPYQAFARKPVNSMAWRLRAEGYRTICIHPFDRRFYRRDIVMENLGFDVFLDEAAFSAPTRPGVYVSDREVTALTLDLLREEGPKIFVFAISMQNHGPWSADLSTVDPVIAARIPLLAGDPALSGFIAGLSDSDRMLDTLSENIADRGDEGIIAFYGDHLPSFPGTFDKLGFVERQSDYVITRPCAPRSLRSRPSVAPRIDLAANELSSAIMSCLFDFEQGRDLGLGASPVRVLR